MSIEQTKKLVYVAGPYSAPTRFETESNVHRAEALGVQVARAGAYPVIPHSNTRPYFEDLQGHDFWLAGTMQLMRRCDAVILLENWHQSSGAKAEVDEASAIGLPVFTNIDALKSWLSPPWVIGRTQGEGGIASLLHSCWGQAKDSPEYRKPEWIELERLLIEVGTIRKAGASAQS